LFRRSGADGTSELRALVEMAARVARARGDPQVEVEHLLLGTLEDQAGNAARTLAALSVDSATVVAELSGLLDARASRAA
jgi:ATP-dependent Clp protease ATP-binding subunit ClpA